MVSKPRELTAQQQRFANAIFEGKTQEEAHKIAGYKAKTSESARATASELLTNPNVRAYLERLREKAALETGVTVARTLKELELIAFSDLQDFATWNEQGLKLKDSQKLEPNKRRVVKSIKFKTKRYVDDDGEAVTETTVEFTREDKLKALELIGKNLGMWKDGGLDGGAGSLERIADEIAKARAGKP